MLDLNDYLTAREILEAEEIGILENIAEAEAEKHSLLQERYLNYLRARHAHVRAKMEDLK